MRGQAKYIKFRVATYRLADMPTYEQQDELDWEAARENTRRQEQTYRKRRDSEGYKKWVEKTGDLHGLPFIVARIEGALHGSLVANNRLGYIGVTKKNPFYGMSISSKVSFTDPQECRDHQHRPDKERHLPEAHTFRAHVAETLEPQSGAVSPCRIPLEEFSPPLL